MKPPSWNSSTNAEGKSSTGTLYLIGVGGIDYFPESRTLDQHIAKLRKRIERAPAAPELIETVRGAGYRYRPRGA